MTVYRHGANFGAVRMIRSSMRPGGHNPRQRITAPRAATYSMPVCGTLTLVSLCCLRHGIGKNRKVEVEGKKGAEVNLKSTQISEG